MQQAYPSHLTCPASPRRPGHLGCLPVLGVGKSRERRAKVQPHHHRRARVHHQPAVCAASVHACIHVRHTHPRHSTTECSCQKWRRDLAKGAKQINQCVDALSKPGRGATTTRACMAVVLSMCRPGNTVYATWNPAARACRACPSSSSASSSNSRLRQYDRSKASPDARIISKGSCCMA